MDERQFEVYFSILYVLDVLDVLPASLASFPPSLVYFTVVTDRTRVLYVACSMIKVDTYGEIQNISRQQLSQRRPSSLRVQSHLVSSS